ncbi:MAG TPA: DUF3592 domain-containing protein, partial [Thermoanaerobaculia bacterium]
MILEIAGLSLFIAVALFLLTPMFRAAARQRARNAWPRMQGVVTAHYVRMRETTGFPEYRIRYEHEGVTHETYCGSVENVGHTRYDNYDVARAVSALMAKRAIGSTAEVMIDPSTSKPYIVERKFPMTLLTVVATLIFIAFL